MPQSRTEKTIGSHGFAWIKVGGMRNRLFLLDAMVLAYRAYFALIRRPVMTSGGVNTSALFGYTQTLMEILRSQGPTHIAVVFDSEVPTRRHEEFPEYKAQREAIPEDLSQALPDVKRMSEAFNIPVLTCEGYEADDVVGTLVRRAEQEDLDSYMVTPDKDFGQLVSDKAFIFKPSRMGEGTEILGVPEICQRWGIERPGQVVDILGLWGDTSDNIPGVPGIGEKTACKLIRQYGSLENLLEHTDELSAKLKSKLEEHREQALLSKNLATIDCDAPVAIELDDLRVREPSSDQLRELFAEFEFKSIERRYFGEESESAPPKSGSTAKKGATQPSLEPEDKPKATSEFKTIRDVAHQYHLVTEARDRANLIETLSQLGAWCFDIETTSLDPQEADILGIAFSFKPYTGYYVHFPGDRAGASRILEELKPLFNDSRIQKVGHNLKFDMSILKWHGIDVHGPLFDTMLAHTLIDPETRHNLDRLSEVFLSYRPVPIENLLGNAKQINMEEIQLQELAEYAAEDADVSWQLKEQFESSLKEKGQERVFYEIEMPLLPVLVDMEYEGIRVDAEALDRFRDRLVNEMREYEKAIYKMAGREFNLNSPRQLGDILFNELKIRDKPKKTKTGQFATDEQTLQGMAPKHPIIQYLLDYREMMKLKSTYADTLPNAISPRTGRVHTTYNQLVTATGRLQSQEPNLQNIPIRTELGREIRKAFVPRNREHQLLAADYSQIELRIIAALSQEPGMLEAFQSGTDIHTSTAAKVYSVSLDQVTSEMRRQAKMVNFGIIYGISAFGLAQRLGIRRQEAAKIIEQYFTQYPKIRGYLDQTIAFAREHGYVTTILGRRRYIRDIRSSNATVRSGAERNAINAPIQGTAADMIKLAMIRVHQALIERNLKTRMLLQVHDELIFDMHSTEREIVCPVVEEKMKHAIPIDCPIVVEMGIGQNWVEAH